MKKQSRKPKPRAQPSGLLQWWPVIVVLILFAGILAMWWASGQPVAAPATPRALGGVSGCFTLPRFLSAIGFSSSAALSTTDDRLMGLALIEPTSDGERRTYQHETWDDAGWLGGLALDERGNIYAVPAPRISLWDNPPTEQTKLYRVDSDTGVMAVLLELPAASPPSQTNPFGLMGVTYDCETRSLYVSSVAGSSLEVEAGRLFRVDVSGPEATLAAHWPNVDAIGVGVFNGAQGKRLYFGSARTSEVRSIALDAQGNFTGAPRVEFSLAEYDPRGDDKARRLTFDSTGGLKVDGLKFNFNLVAGSEHRHNVYRFAYDSNTDRWQFLEMSSVLKGGP